MISVIIPAYQAEDYIEETINSVLNQTYQDLELIVVNDGSTDQTNAILDLYEGNSRIKVLNVENGGVSRARNIGFHESKGEFVAFLDADDVWLSTNLKQKVDYMKEHTDVGLVHSNTEVIDGSGKRSGNILEGKGGYILDDLLLWNETCIPAPSSILLRRNVVEEVGGFEESLSTAADQEFFFRVANKYLIGKIDEVTWHYRVHESNMHQNISRMESDHLLAYQLAEKSNLFSSKRFRNRCFSNLYMILGASWWGNSNKPFRGLRFIMKAIVTYPPVMIDVVNKLWKRVF